jgi:polysaccharide biosynthesis transport protein
MPAAQTADANVIQVESETRILTSDKVLRRVVESEHLTSDPEFGSRGKSLMTMLRETVGLGSAAKPADAELAALRQLQKNVTAKRSERTYVVDLTVDTADPQKSARVANAIAQAYLDEQTDARAEASRRVTDSLSSRLSELRERVRSAEEQVERYKREHNIVGASGRLVDEQQLTELNNQLGTAKARTAEAKARYEQLVRQQRSGADPGATAEAVASNTIGRLREQYATVARQEANLAAELGPRHPWVIDARAQVRNARQLISEELTRVAEANRNDYERALANENSLAESLDALKRKAMDTSLAFVKLRELERETEASRAVYESFLGRAREMREQERLDTANVRVLSDAQPPQDRAWPPRRLIMLLGALMAGALGGIGLAYIVELMRGNRSGAAQPIRKAA